MFESVNLNGDAQGGERDIEVVGVAVEAHAVVRGPGGEVALVEQSVEELFGDGPRFGGGCAHHAASGRMVNATYAIEGGAQVMDGGPASAQCNADGFAPVGGGEVKGSKCGMGVAPETQIGGDVAPGESEAGVVVARSALGGDFYVVGPGLRGERAPGSGVPTDHSVGVPLADSGNEGVGVGVGWRVDARQDCDQCSPAGMGAHH